MPKNSAQIQNFGGVNFVDCSVLCIERNSKRALLQKDNKALISEMTVFSHLNDYIVLTNFKLQNTLNT